MFRKECSTVCSVPNDFQCSVSSTLPWLFRGEVGRSIRSKAEPKDPTVFAGFRSSSSPGSSDWSSSTCPTRADQLDAGSGGGLVNEWTVEV